jgi:hypothetical protein
LYPNKRSILLIIFAALCVVASLPAQDIDTTGIDTILPVDTVETSLWPALVRSAIIPGWGQIIQENPGRAVIFYGLTLAFLSNMIENYHQYNDTKQTSYKIKYRRYGIFLFQVYALNIADVIESHRKGDDRPWPQDLYSDQPLKSPWGAVARSAMLPGWGQSYNESYIKSVVAFGAFFYFASRVYTYNKKYQDTGDVNYRDKRVDNSWYLGLTYMIIMIDAYVDAYLYRFDDAVSITYNYYPDVKEFRVGVSIVF